MSWTDRLIVCWLAAATVHLPMPVGDGDDLKSGEMPVAGAVCSGRWDVDVVLLGCDPPDDCDDGPVDDDPENGTSSPLGSYLAHVHDKTPDGPRGGNAWPHRPGAIVRHLFSDRWCCKPPRTHRRPLRNLSFGQACQAGWAVMRC